jgi:predicted RNase H-like HicB family nuclease
VTSRLVAPAQRRRTHWIQYLVRINRDPHSDWGASVPDLPGCVATGKTLDSMLRRIEQAVALHVRGLREDGLPVPRPSHRTVTPRRRPREISFHATVEVAASRTDTFQGLHPDAVAQVRDHVARDR